MPVVRARCVWWLCEEMGVPYQLVVEKVGAPSADYLRTTIAQRLDFFDRQLGDQPFIVGSRFTAADISIGYSFGMAAFAAGSVLSPRLQAYQQRLMARPVYQRALATAE